MRTETSKVLTEQLGEVWLVTINRPEVLNAIDPETSELLRRAFETYRDREDLRVAVLTGAGTRAFSTGNDLAALSKAQASGNNAVSAALMQVPFGGITRDFQCWKPIIAAIRGYCLAGGLEVALSCDLRIAGQDAQFGMPEVTLGLVPGASGTQRLPRTMALSSALELALTGQRFSATWAQANCLVNEVVPTSHVIPRAMELAERLCENGPIAVQLIKHAMTAGCTLDFESGLELERRLSLEALATWDASEGPRAFVEKRKPRFRGR